MATLTMTKGLPASGKSSWAAEQVLARPAGSMVRVNRDLLREMLHLNRFEPGTEERVVVARDAVVGALLRLGVDVVVDDTNLDPDEKTRLWSIAADAGAELVVQDFTAVPLEVCIARDAAREHPVGEAVIREMHLRWFTKPA